MAYALYRKYRPKLFSELLGQELIAEILREAAKQNKIAHAYLFSGPRGTGKTTIARLIAKIANCPNRDESGEPCNVCSFCKTIDEGRNLDVIEIDAASNRGIDEVRDLKENIRTTPMEARYKVFIIDEAHMLTNAAWNALLKTIEEPPAYVLFILATTELDKVPATIASRTQQFHFQRPTVKQITEKLKRIGEGEKVKISEEACELIAAQAEGSFRDAESLLDQLISTGRKEISLEETERAIGKIGFQKLSAFAGEILKGDLAKTLETLYAINDEGYNLAQFAKDLISYLRRTAVLSFSPQMKNVIAKELTDKHLEQLEKHAKLFKDKHLELLKALITAYSQMRYSQFPLIPLEIALIENLK
jgi:DNA polymerase-3 subunit gamma/tau